MLEWYHPADYAQGIEFAKELAKAVLQSGDQWPLIPHAQGSVDDKGDPHVDQKRFVLTEYPVEQAALARVSDDGSYAERFEMFADGLELCNGFCELLDSAEQRKRFEYERWQRQQNGWPTFSIDEELLASLDQINGPVTGVAMGVDRLVMLKYGVSDINDIQLFPAKERWS